MGFKKGTTRLTWVISLILGTFGTLVLIAGITNEDDNLIDIGAMCICGFGGVWLINRIIIFVVRGFTNPVCENCEREFKAKDKVRFHDGHVVCSRCIDLLKEKKHNIL